MLIHKMKTDWGNPNSNGSIYPNNPWPATSNPYLPTAQTNHSSSMSPQGTTTVVTSEDMKKLAKIKKYRSIDDPWEGA